MSTSARTPSDGLLGRPIPPPEGDFKWVYLWGLPLRAMHWVAAGCIVVLVLTGLFIGWPFFFAGNQPGLLVSRARLLHFLAAMVLTATAVVRIYWLAAGDKFERWHALFPVQKRDFTNLVKIVKFYMLIDAEKAPHYLGHNPLQQLSYTGLYVLAALEVLTGFIMFGQSAPTGTIYALTNGLIPLFGGVQVVRFIHHVLTWIFVCFMTVHIYLSARADVVEGGGLVSSMVTGGRFFRAKKHYEDE